MQLDAHDCLAPFEHLLEDAHQVHQRNHQLAFDVLAFVERKIGLRPDVRFELLLFVEQLRGVLEFFVLDQAMHQLGARIGLLFRRGERVGRQQHLRLDQNQRRRHVDEIGGDVHVELFELVQDIRDIGR